jgi:hypothetical protein
VCFAGEIIDVQEETVMSTPKQRFFQTILIIILLAAFLRIMGYIIRFAGESLQMDFSAYYTAGESVNHGLSPYKNNITEPAKIWDGYNILPRSRFLYPPLAANIFQLFALIPYLAAKYVWAGISLICLLASLYLSIKGMNLPIKSISFLILGIFVCVYYPLLILFERGQIDTLTLLFLISGISLLANRRRTFFAGVLFALAILLKLHCIYLLPFLALRKQWKAILGASVAGLCLILLSTIINGPSSTLSYLQNKIATIPNTNPNNLSNNTPFNLAAKEEVKDLPSLYTRKDGHIYLYTSMTFEVNATLVRTEISNMVNSITRKLFGQALGVSGLSLFYFGIAFIALGVWGGPHPSRFQEADPSTEFIYWQIPLVIILLCAPLTWTMNCVWLLPAAPVFLVEISRLGQIEPSAKVNGWILAVCAGVLGILLAAMPDSLGFRMLVPFGERFVKYKYVVGEMLVLAGLLGVLRLRQNHRICTRQPDR